jgi:hypothetical protein
MAPLLPSLRRALAAVLIFALTTTAFGQDPRPSEGGPTPPSVSGHLQGQVALKAGESVVILLMAGYSDTLSTQIAQGVGPAISLSGGRSGQILAPGAARTEAGELGRFEFRDVAPGEYQVVAVKLADAGMTGTAIAEGPRLVVGDESVREIQLTVVEKPEPPAPPLRGGADGREPSVLDPSIHPPLVTVIPPPRAVGGGVYKSSTSKKKEFLGALIFVTGAILFGWVITR